MANLCATLKTYSNRWIWRWPVPRRQLTSATIASKTPSSFSSISNGQFSPSMDVKSCFSFMFCLCFTILVNCDATNNCYMRRFGKHLLNILFDLYDSRSEMRLRLGFLRRRSTESALSARPSPEEARKWSESFSALMASKCKLHIKLTIIFLLHNIGSFFISFSKLFALFTFSGAKIFQ